MSSNEVLTGRCPEPLPCPFCGASGSNLWVQTPRNDDGFHRDRFILCIACHARGPIVSGPPVTPEENGRQPLMPIYEAWNRRGETGPPEGLRPRHPAWPRETPETSPEWEEARKDRLRREFGISRRMQAQIDADAAAELRALSVRVARLLGYTVTAASDSYDCWRLTGPDGQIVAEAAPALPEEEAWSALAPRFADPETNADRSAANRVFVAGINRFGSVNGDAPGHLRFGAHPHAYGDTYEKAVCRAFVAACDAEAAVATPGEEAANA
jgi:hypothetical protein